LIEALQSSWHGGAQTVGYVSNPTSPKCDQKTMIVVTEGMLSSFSKKNKMKSLVSIFKQENVVLVKKI